MTDGRYLKSFKIKKLLFLQNASIYRNEIWQDDTQANGIRQY